MKYLLPLILFISSISYADTSGDAAYLNLGDKAPFAGYLISPDKADKVRLMDIDLSTCKYTDNLKDEELTLAAQRLDNAKKEQQYLNDELVKTRSGEWLTKAGYFVLGVAATSLIAFGVSRTLR